MLDSSRVEANIPASNLARARDFYADKLGLTPSQEYEGVAMSFRTTAGTSFNLYETEYAGLARHTIAQWHVDDIEKEVEDLKAKGVEFQVFDLPGVEWQAEVASLPGMGRAAWFTDSEGNVMCLDQAEEQSQS
jgi:predicted enzyme related to lactoylglutathione lyase